MAHWQPTALVVDDDPAVCDTVAAMLGCLGMAVLKAGSGHEALALLQQHPEIDMLLTDIEMPGITGLDLARAVRELRPEVQVVLTSGGTGHAGMPDLPFLPKPWRFGDLARVIRTGGADALWPSIPEPICRTVLA